MPPLFLLLEPALETLPTPTHFNMSTKSEGPSRLLHPPGPGHRLGGRSHWQSWNPFPCSRTPPHTSAVPSGHPLVWALLQLQVPAASFLCLIHASTGTLSLDDTCVRRLKYGTVGMSAARALRRVGSNVMWAATRSAPILLLLLGTDIQMPLPTTASTSSWPSTAVDPPGFPTCASAAFVHPYSCPHSVPRARFAAEDSRGYGSNVYARPRTASRKPSPVYVLNVRTNGDRRDAGYRPLSSWPGSRPSVV